VLEATHEIQKAHLNIIFSSEVPCRRLFPDVVRNTVWYKWKIWTL